MRCFCLSAALLLWSAEAAAHDESASSSRVTVSDRALVWKAEVGVGGLAKVVEFPVAELEITDADLAAAKDAVAAYLRRGLVVQLDGRVVEPTVGALEPVYEANPVTGSQYVGRAALELRYQADQPIQRVQARVAFFSDLTSQHRAVILVRWGEMARQHVRLGPSDLAFAGGEGSSAWQVLREFVAWGAEHIFIGYDHIAFLMALLLVASGFRELVKIVTSFTVAHSFTLLLAALDVLRIPSRLTEVLIAASIVYVAAENLWMKRSEHRWWLTFVFGLVHGLGFATQLRERLAELQGGVILPVVSFNLGVELGQVAIVSLAFPLLLLARRRLRETDRQRQLVRFGSIPILLLGLYWLVERIGS